MTLEEANKNIAKWSEVSEARRSLQTLHKCLSGGGIIKIEVTTDKYLSRYEFVLTPKREERNSILELLIKNRKEILERIGLDEY